MQEASAKRKSPHQEPGRREVIGQAENLVERQCSGNGESPQAAVLSSNKGTKPRPSSGAWQRKAKAQAFNGRSSGKAKAGCRRERR